MLKQRAGHFQVIRAGDIHRKAIDERAEEVFAECGQGLSTTPLYRLKTPSQKVAMVLSALAEGLDASAAERVFGFRQATITRWLTRAGRHAESLHERFFSHLRPMPFK